MIKTHLSSIEIQDLINRYNSELKKLEFQTEDIKLTISGLENLMKAVSSKQKSSFIKPKSNKTISVEFLATKGSRTTKYLEDNKVDHDSSVKKNGILKKLTGNPEPGGYKLSNWDTFVIESIEKTGKVRITQEILDYVKAKMESSGKKTNDAEVKNKVTRSLQKLVNRRGDLSKVSYKGKGFAYALPAWLNRKGKLLSEYKR
jgi:hypothetical protein